MIRRILIIDNDPFYRTVLEGIFNKRLHIRIVQVAQNQESMDIAKLHQPHLIIYNVSPSDIISFMVFDCLKNNTQAKVIVLLNPVTDQKIHDEFHRKGADLVLQRDRIGRAFQETALHFLT